MIGFDPIHKDNFKCFFSIGTAWGILEWTNTKVSVIIKEGYLNLNKFFVTVNAKSVLLDGKEMEFTQKDNMLYFDDVTIEKDLVVVI